MKKKILFVIPSLSSGGAEKSLVNLLNSFDYSSYDVDLVLFNRKGIFLDMIPANVNIIKLPATYQLFSQGLLSSIAGFLKMADPILALNRLLFTVKNNAIKNTNVAEQKSWANLQKSILKLDKQYDVAVGYLEKTSIYFAVDCVNATKKIGFIRTNYSKLGLDKEFDKTYFDKLDYLCANGHESLKILDETFPSLKDKLKVIMNVVSPTMIHKLAEENIDLKKTKTTLLSIGRLENVKGFDLSVEAAHILKNKGLDFHWFIIGTGREESNLKALIDKFGLTDNVFLIGEKANPYPYIKMCDIYVQTSRFEGRSSTINEAKIMHKPIVVTDFDSVFEQITTNVNGTIVGKNPAEISKGILELTNNNDSRLRYIEALSNEKLGTEDQIKEFYKLIES